jgi:hypothetical protein
LSGSHHSAQSEITNKVMVLGLLLCQDKYILVPSFIDLVRVSSSKRLRWQTPLGDMPRDCWIGVVFGYAHPYVFLSVWFQRKRDDALLPVAIMGHVLRAMVKSDMENDMKTEFLMTSSDGPCLRGDEELAS